MTYHSIQSVVDFGCGDWQSSKLIDWDGIQYQGFDVVETIIEDNKRQFSRPNIRFEIADVSAESLPSADLLIIKEVLQHWPNEAILELLPSFESYKYVLLTNTVNPEGKLNNYEDINVGEARYLDLLGPPFNVEGKEVLNYIHKIMMMQYI